MASCGTPLDILNAEGPPFPGCFLLSTSTRTSTPSPFSGSSLGSQTPAQLTSASTTNFFDEAIGLPQAPVDSTMPVPGADQAETDLFDILGSTPSSAASKPAQPKTRARKRGPSSKSNAKKNATNNKASTQRSPLQADVPKSKPRKRGRPKTNFTEADLEEYPQEELAEDGLPKDPRRRRVLERNRIAATKCRNRRRDEAQDLALQEQEAENRHRYLSAVCDSLTSEIYELKTQLLGHSDCRCELIQAYIAHEARKSVDTMSRMLPSFRGTNQRASIGESSSGSLYTSPEAEGTPVWTAPFQIMPAAATPASTGCDSAFDKYAMASMIPEQHGIIQLAALPGAVYNTNANGIMALPEHSSGPMVHALTADTGYWDPWETQ